MTIFVVWRPLPTFCIMIATAIAFAAYAIPESHTRQSYGENQEILGENQSISPIKKICF